MEVFVVTSIVTFSLSEIMDMFDVSERYKSLSAGLVVGLAVFLSRYR